MTICIGALCANDAGLASRAVVVASDRMVTLGNLTEFEHEVPKLTPITNKVVALMAGDALKGSRIAREVSGQIPAGNPTVQAIAELTAQHYTQLRNDHINSTIFAPRGISLAEFYQGGLQQRMITQLAGAIDQQVAQFNYGVDLLVAGLDDSGAHLYNVGNPGGLISDFQQIGYHAIGSGTLHALQSMIGFGHMSARSLPDTIFTVYVSKRRAEVAPGVGHDTDMAVIVDGEIKRIETSILDELEKVYVEYQAPISKELKEKVSKMTFYPPKEEVKANAIKP